MNLHSLVRGMVGIVNPDTPAILLRSAGYTTGLSGHREPRYLQAQSVMIQVQPTTSEDIRHAEYLNLQGEFRVVYGYGSTEGIIRPTEKGGDLLRFPPYPGEPILTWLTTQSIESWQTGWSKVFVTLQNDAP